MLKALISSAALLAGVLASATANGQSRVAPPTRSETLQIELTSTIRAKKAKVGDAVKARTVTALVLPNQTVVPEGSKLIGHVCVANSERSNGSAIGIAFDEVQVKNGTKLRLNFSIRAGAMPQATVSEAAASQDDFAQVIPAPPDPRRHPTPDALRQMGRTSQHGSSSQPQTEWTLDDRRELRSAPGGTLIGVPGVTLAVDGPAGAATFRSSSQKLELKSGLQLMLRVRP